MGKHGPKTVQGLRRKHLPRELRDVAVKVGANQAPAKRKAVLVAGRKQAVGEPSPQPVLGACGNLRRHVKNIERAERHVLDAPRQTLPGLLEQVQGSGPENQEPSRATTCAPTGIDDPPKLREEAGKPMDLLQHNEAVFVLLEKHRRGRKARPIRRRLEIQVDRLHLVANANRQGSFPHLPRPHERHSSLPPQRDLHPPLCMARNHPC